MNNKICTVLHPKTEVWLMLSTLLKEAYSKQHFIWLYIRSAELVSLSPPCRPSAPALCRQNSQWTLVSLKRKPTNCTRKGITLKQTTSQNLWSMCCLRRHTCRSVLLLVTCDCVLDSQDLLVRQVELFIKISSLFIKHFSFFPFLCVSNLIINKESMFQKHHISYLVLWKQMHLAVSEASATRATQFLCHLMLVVKSNTSINLCQQIHDVLIRPTLTKNWCPTKLDGFRNMKINYNVYSNNCWWCLCITSFSGKPTGCVSWTKINEIDDSKSFWFHLI